MSKKEEFKIFISKHPELVSYIKNREHTWQDFYEIFDIYGDNKEVWDKYQNKSDYEDRQAPLNELTNIVKNINMDNVQKYIINAQKAINVIQELTSKNPVKTPPVPKTPRPITKFFGD
ncbi:MAG: spore coat protein YlbD [Bacilli bacterium]|nr:spore coat protein YlbD [Bacilli bacterium]MDD3896034.1 spore coat protein YlbD [Bacilli bacterium]MDD4408020.1 spore coat protein YlbD [Bacilli bacterium]